MLIYLAKFKAKSNAANIDKYVSKYFIGNS